MGKTPGIFFFIGTEAELIKVFPVMRELRNMGLSFHVIASGQNNIVKSRIFELADCGQVELELNNKPLIRRDAIGLLLWWLHTYLTAPAILRKKYADIDFRHSKLVIHGDTVSTLMGAELGHRFGMKIYHIEAGLRSHNLLEPFPEEIDRLLASRRAHVHFAPGKEAKDNLRNVKGIVFNTRQNTLMDSLKFSRTVEADPAIKPLLREDYFVFVMHRQENLINKSFVSDVIREIRYLAGKKKCFFILHEITKEALVTFGLMDELKSDPNFVLLPRLDYFDFMKVLSGSRYVITDGGSNQEELYYMGKPCFILRKRTERREGIGKNATLFSGDVREIGKFGESIPSGQADGFIRSKSPSEFIARVIRGKII